MNNEFGWQVHNCGATIHVVPVGDTHEHDFNSQCRCHPEQEPGMKSIFVHNSYDGREAFEKGERKAS
jgi:hypothetical protein